MIETAPKSTKKPVKNSVKTVKNTPKVAEKAEKPPKNDNSANEITFTYELMSVSALSRMFDIDRATIRTRLENAQIKPKKISANEKLYEFDEKLEMVLRQDELEVAKLRKTEAEADLKEHDLAVKRGEYASVAEFTEVIQRIFGKLHKKVCVQMPKRIALRLHEANSAAELAKLLETELAKEFNDLRSDHKKYI